MKKVTLEDVVVISLLKDCIYIKENFGEWYILLDKWEQPFYNLELAISYYRDNREKFNKYIQLSCYNQARIGNAEWDNF